MARKTSVTAKSLQFIGITAFIFFSYFILQGLASLTYNVDISLVNIRDDLYYSSTLLYNGFLAFLEIAIISLWICYIISLSFVITARDLHLFWRIVMPFIMFFTLLISLELIVQLGNGQWSWLTSIINEQSKLYEYINNYTIGSIGIRIGIYILIALILSTIYILTVLLVLKLTKNKDQEFAQIESSPNQNPIN